LPAKLFLTQKRKGKLAYNLLSQLPIRIKILTVVGVEPKNDFISPSAARQNRTTSSDILQTAAFKIIKIIGNPKNLT
jgi:hypothetical protein